MTRTRRQRERDQEADLQRWDDDGGFIPELVAEAPPRARSPWITVGVAAGLGFVLGWLTGRR